MSQILLNVDDASILPSLLEVLSAVKGVSIVESDSYCQSGIDKALEDVAKGQVNQYSNADELFKSLGI